MRDHYEKLFHEVPYVHLPERLLRQVCSAIRREETRRARRALILNAAFFAVFITAAVPVARSFAAEFMQSGFAQYFSLFFSDGKIVMTFWKDALMSLLESLPFMTGAALLAVTALSLTLLRNIAAAALSLLATRVGEHA